jgi:hypothetical protein
MMNGCIGATFKSVAILLAVALGATGCSDAESPAADMEWGREDGRTPVGCDDDARGVGRDAADDYTEWSSSSGTDVAEDVLDAAQYPIREDSFCASYCEAVLQCDDHPETARLLERASGTGTSSSAYQQCYLTCQREGVWPENYALDCLAAGERGEACLFESDVMSTDQLCATLHRNWRLP